MQKVAMMYFANHLLNTLKHPLPALSLLITIMPNIMQIYPSMLAEIHR